MKSPIDIDEIENIVGFYLPLEIDAESWGKERAHAIQVIAEVINRRVEERLRDE